MKFFDMNKFYAVIAEYRFGGTGFFFTVSEGRPDFDGPEPLDIENDMGSLAWPEWAKEITAEEYGSEEYGDKMEEELRAAIAKGDGEMELWAVQNGFKKIFLD